MIPRKQLVEMSWDAEGIFRERPNRFLGMVDMAHRHGGAGQAVHIHDPGRLKELLFPGNRVLLRRADTPGRKTRWTLMAAMYHDRWILVNSGMHRQISYALLTDPAVSPLGPVSTIVPEVRAGKSRLDYCITLPGGDTVWVEVKGCTLSRNHVALFPDAPTRRGVRHVMELVKLLHDGNRAALLLLIFRNDVHCFAPNRAMDPEFSRTFSRAITDGVEVYPLICSCSGGYIWFEQVVPVCPEYI